MKHFNELQEGLQDPNIFKAFFLAGGPGSGKSYVVRKTTGGTGLRVVNSDDAFESLLQKAGLSLKMPPEEEEPRDMLVIVQKMLQNVSKLPEVTGLIIDSPQNYDKIAKQPRNPNN